MAKDPAAVALGRKRWVGISEEDRKSHASMAGKARLDTISARKRSAIAKKAAETRWAKQGATK